MINYGVSMILLFFGLEWSLYQSYKNPPHPLDMERLIGRSAYLILDGQICPGLSTTDFFEEKYCRQTEKLKCSAPAEVVQPLPNLPAPAEVCPAPVSPAEVCSSWTQKSSRRRNVYNVNAPKFTLITQIMR